MILFDIKQIQLNTLHIQFRQHSEKCIILININFCTYILLIYDQIDLE